MADNKYFILSQEQIDADREWYTQMMKIKNNKHITKAAYQLWMQNNPCPLPSPVEVPSDEEIDKEFEKVIYGSPSDAEKDKIARFFSIKAAKWLRDLIFNKQ